MATAKLVPFLWYTKNAEEAAKFYCSIFPNSKVNYVGTMNSDSPSGPPGSVKVVEFTLLGQPLHAMGAEHPSLSFNDAVSFMVEVDNQKELDKYWYALLEGGGKELACGWLMDRYGLRWQITPKMLNDALKDKDKARSKRITDAMITMIKIDIAKLQIAFDG